LRLDKFLKLSRIIKRRAVAKEACLRGRVMVNGRTAKAGTDIKVGDVIEINFGHKLVKFKIRAVFEPVPAGRARELYEVLEECEVVKEKE